MAVVAFDLLETMPRPFPPSPVVVYRWAGHSSFPRNAAPPAEAPHPDGTALHLADREINGIWASAEVEAFCFLTRRYRRRCTYRGGGSLGWGARRGAQYEE